MPNRICGIYALTPDGEDDAALLRMCDDAMDGGIRLLQYRNRGGDADCRRRQARQLAAMCRRRRITFIVNNDVALAAEVAADGVHLGGGDMPIRRARDILGERALIGATCRAAVGLAEEAVAAGADYVAFGAVYPSPSKADTTPCSLDVVQAGKQRISAPLVAIGGITAATVGDVVAAGADAVAVISGLFGEADRRAAARRLCAAFDAAKAAK